MFEVALVNTLHIVTISANFERNTLRKYVFLISLLGKLYNVFVYFVAASLNNCCCFNLTYNDYGVFRLRLLIKMRPGQNDRRFADDTVKCISLNENVRISIKMSLKFVPKGPLNNNPALVRIMAWRRPGDKPLSETMMVILPTHICVTRPQWVICVFIFEDPVIYN